MDLKKEVLTVRELAELLGTHPRNVYYAINENNAIPNDLIIRWGARFYFKRIPTLKWLRNNLNEEFVNPSSDETNSN